MEHVVSVATICVAFVVFGGLYWAGHRIDRRRQSRVDTIMAEIMARPSTILWIDEDGTIHSTLTTAEATVEYLDRCVATLRAQATERRDASTPREAGLLAHDGRGATGEG